MIREKELCAKETLRQTGKFKKTISREVID